VTGRRVLLGACALLCAAFAAYGSLVPLDLQPLTLQEALDRFARVRWVPLMYASKSDFVANVTLFVPIGFFVAAAAADRSRAVALVLLPVVVGFAFALSVAIEFGQVYSATRTPSYNDIVAETFGAGAGALAYAAVGPWIISSIGRIWTSESPHDRLARLLALYAAAWVVLGVLPFDFILRLEELGDKVREGGVVLDLLGHGHDLSARFLDAAGSALLAVPVGALAGLLLPPLAAAAAGTGAVGALEVLQVFVRSRTADITDVIGGVAGALAGVMVVRRWARGDTLTARGVHPGAQRHLWAAGLLVIWCGVLVVRHWDPFEFRLDPAFVKARLSHLAQLPFRGYYWAMPLNALAEAITKILLGVPVGALLQIAVPAGSGRALAAARLMALAGVSGVIFLGVELGQVLLPSRYPDLTDVLLGTGGALCGMAAGHIVARGWAGRS
jgi:glycopeptide antibiotics resistance protein